MSATPTPELVALVTDDTVQIALDASDAYWNADDRLEKCLACNGTGKVPCGESQDWCDCDGGTVNNGTEAGAMRAALDAVEATRAATVPQGVWLPIESAPKDDCQRVLILKDCGPGSWPSVSVAYFFGGQWQLNDGHVSAESWGYRVTHWHSLPAPPAIDATTTPPPAELGRGS